MGKKRDFVSRFVEDAVEASEVTQELEEETAEAPEEVTEEETTVEPEVEEVIEEIENTAEAVIDGVAMSLNIRKNPKVEANNQIAILGAGTKIIVVDPDKPILKDGIEWLKVRLIGKDKKDPTGNGYAMKKYIKVI